MKGKKDHSTGKSDGMKDHCTTSLCMLLLSIVFIITSRHWYPEWLGRYHCSIITSIGRVGLLMSRARDGTRRTRCTCTVVRKLHNSTLYFVSFSFSYWTLYVVTQKTFKKQFHCRLVACGLYACHWYQFYRTQRIDQRSACTSWEASGLGTVYIRPSVRPSVTHRQTGTWTLIGWTNQASFHSKQHMGL